MAPATFRADLVWDYRLMFSYPFMVSAFRAGTIVAVMAGALGWFMVLRRQSFTGHTLSVVGFPGAAGAVLIGVSSQWGYYAFCVAAAVVIGLASRPAGRAGTGYSAESAVVAMVQAAALAAGFLFYSLYHGFLGGVETLLFGTFLGIDQNDVWTLAILAVVVLVVLVVVARPLLWASIDGSTAAATGLPVRSLGLVFLILLAVSVAAASQITGSLLVFALLVAPPAAAQRLTQRPGLSLALAVGFAVLITWAALVAAFFSTYPIGFWLTSFAFGLYVVVIAAVAGSSRRRNPRPAPGLRPIGVSP
jgi:zinc/manganese transport system permease protein